MTTPIGEINAAATLAGFSGLVGAYIGDNLFTTILPTLIGTGVHVMQRSEMGKLTVKELVLAAVVAFAVGFWGGPWMAEMSPASERALPFMCFFFAMWATTLIKLAGDFVAKKLGGANGDP